MEDQQVPAWQVPLEAVKQQLIALKDTEAQHHNDLVERLEKIDKNLDGRLNVVEKALNDKESKSDFGQFLVKYGTELGGLDLRLKSLEDTKNQQKGAFTAVHYIAIIIGALLTLAIAYVGVAIQTQSAREITTNTTTTTNK